jgi:hypothetical protein
MGGNRIARYKDGEALIPVQYFTKNKSITTGFAGDSI